MAITVDPISTTATVVTDEPINATNLWGDRLTIDATARDFAKIVAEVTVTPYTDAGVFASKPIVHRTKSAAAAAQYVPELGVAIAAIQAGIGAMHREVVSRQATLATAQAALTTAQTAESDAQAARNVAFAGRSGVDDPAWLAADAAWIAAKTATATAAERAKTATAAADDVANPPLS